ncbi:MULTISPECIES: Gfo/Idh/MocA family oxidoreductase [Vibrio]|uniref:Gfo/Idh/MocA family oxidoreductase n=1 Tax=Vibrio TaxID=662 RepID=UPI002075C753|nr:MULTISPECIES: Gfo/Idh/MocA family oxidoreductase [Vibrio]USD32713.1 Gfo/Idh/MocA family oxidoreductase [Vibrio sp. SCSIO 43186]USD45753.1 Gfo/Idh/MocA family oxidoreductase [Vibrio sp. SCSIO 43145]USD69838.1 Gfo/Idh/MocA family oxidoreductase [Vibrio sp. SCSIO 43139]USD94745.1 dehydrogenase [Vibrio coralliilyticus]
MYNVLIIGAGQLGSRHLQGALLSVNQLNITVVDPSPKSLDVAKERAGQVQFGNANSTIIYSSDIPKNKSYDVCIIATAAKVRAAVTKQLLAFSRVEHIIFEKVLFQKLVDYTEVRKILKDTNTTGWVNCPRRLFSTYVELKEALNTSKPISMAVKGNAWGMSCNSIHFIDIFSYLIDSTSLNLTESELSPELIESKRVGFYETTGKMKFISEEHSLVLECNRGDELNLSLSIENGVDKYIINESDGNWTQSVGGVQTEKAYIPLLQSELTGGNIDDLVLSNTCGLTPFSQSCALHIPFIKSQLMHMSAVLEKELDACPIT